MSCQRKRGLLLTFAIIMVTAGTSYGAPSLVGDTVEIWGVAQSSGTEFLRDTVQVVDPGIEYTATIISDIYNLNIGPTSIVLDTLEGWYSPWFDSGFPPSTLEIRGLEAPGMPGLSIGAVNVIFSNTIVPEPGAPPGYPAFSTGNVTFTADTVVLQTGPYSFPTGSRVQIDLTLVPEPGAATLMGSALFGAIMLIRARSRRMN